jgi:hypothetical protein
MRQTVSKLRGSENARTPPDRAMPNANAIRSAEITKPFNSFGFIAVPFHFIWYSHFLQPDSSALRPLHAHRSQVSLMGRITLLLDLLPDGTIHLFVQP